METKTKIIHAFLFIATIAVYSLWQNGISIQVKTYSDYYFEGDLIDVVFQVKHFGLVPIRLQKKVFRTNLDQHAIRMIVRGPNVKEAGFQTTACGMERYGCYLYPGQSRSVSGFLTSSGKY